MGYACPVCETPQTDARHLANHLAFTALLGDDDHETWLDEHAPEWESAGERELADRALEHAAEVEFPQVFEDTTGRHDHREEGPRPGELAEEPSRPRSRSRSRGPNAGRPDLDAETADAIERAREMTREARDESDGDGSRGEHAADENG